MGDFFDNLNEYAELISALFTVPVAIISAFVFLYRDRRARQRDDMRSRQQNERLEKERLQREDAAKKKQEREEKERTNINKQTARYWFSYNVTNRINQNLSVIELFSERLTKNTTATYESIHTKIHNALSEMVRGTPTKKDFPDSHRTEYKDLRQDISIMLDGFKNTWKNDDALTQKFSFEFSNLAPNQRIELLKYFEEYNSLEDRVEILIPLVNDVREEYDTAAFVTSEVGKITLKISEVIKSSIEVLQAIIKEGEIDPNQHPAIYRARYHEHLIKHSALYDLLEELFQLEGAAIRQYRLENKLRVIE